MNPDESSLLVDIEQWARERCAHHDSAHDLLHLERVIRVAYDILKYEESADRFVTIASCWLHDVVQLPKGAGKPGESAKQSATEARDLLEQIRVNPTTADHICDAISTHSFSGGQEPGSIEAAILQDADRIDAVGAIGIARLWIVAANLDTGLYDLDDPLGLARSLDDRKATLDHIQTKLLKLPSTMNTQRGREIAEGRARFLAEYLVQFAGEIGVYAPAAIRVRALIQSGQLNARIVSPDFPTPSVADAARALDVDETQILKSLLFSNGCDHVLAIANGRNRVKSELLEAAAGYMDLKLARPGDVLQITGFEVGAMPPVGHVPPLSTIIDTCVTDLAVAYAGGGTVDSLLEITPEEIVSQTSARIASITE